MVYLVSCFLFYSMVGFCLEVLYARLTHSSKQDRKCFLLLPLCPVYGFGAVSILLLPGWIAARPLLLFAAGGLTATAVEYGMALLYEFGPGVRFWDYGALPGNLSGRVCLPFAALWGLLALGLVDFFHPLAAGMLRSLPVPLVLICFFLLAADAPLSLILLHRAGTPQVLRWYVHGKGT